MTASFAFIFNAKHLAFIAPLHCKRGIHRFRLSPHFTSVQKKDYQATAKNHSPTSPSPSTSPVVTILLPNELHVIFFLMENSGSEFAVILFLMESSGSDSAVIGALVPSKVMDEPTGVSSADADDGTPRLRYHETALSFDEALTRSVFLDGGRMKGD